jgi:hypothetical protein
MEGVVKGVDGAGEASSFTSPLPIPFGAPAAAQHACAWLRDAEEAVAHHIRQTQPA